MTQKPQSIAQIAEICGVSKATVSRVINNNPRGVGEKTRRRVLKTIEELNYRPNTLARSIATSRSGMIGLIVPDVSNFFYPRVIRGVMDYMDTENYAVILGNSNYSPKTEAEQLLNLIDKRVDGIILCSGVSNRDFLADFRKYNVPLGLIGRSFDISLSDTSISGNNISGGYLSSSYLLKAGKKRIAYVEGNPDISGSRQRMQGYIRAHTERNMEVSPELLISGDYSIDFGKQAADHLLDSVRKFDAVITGSDLIAIGLVLRLQERGIRIPEDIEIIGYDNIELTNIFSPRLSTVSKPHYDMAKHLAGQLLRIIRRETVSLPHTLVEPSLVLRETTAQRDLNQEF